MATIEEVVKSTSGNVERIIKLESEYDFLKERVVNTEKVVDEIRNLTCVLKEQISEIKNLTQNIKETNNNIEKRIVENTANTKSDFDKLDERLKVIEDEPGKRWRGFWEKVVYSIVAAVLTYVLTSIGIF